MLVREGFIAIWNYEPDVAIETWNRSLEVDPGNYEALKALKKFSRAVPTTQVPNSP